MAVALQNTEWLNASHMLQIWQGSQTAAGKSDQKCCFGILAVSVSCVLSNRFWSFIVAFSLGIGAAPCLWSLSCKAKDAARSGCLTIYCPRSFRLVKSRGCAHLVALGLVLMMLRCVMVKIAKLVDLIEMHKTDCYAETRLVLHVPSSSWAGK